MEKLLSTGATHVHPVFAWKRSLPYVVERVNAGTEAAVQGEDLAVDKGGEREIVEQVRERLPHVGIPILSETLVVEAVHL